MDALKNMGPIQVKSAVDILIDRLTQAIIDGTFKAGEKIPPEPELASIFGVGRNTIREAVRTLEAYGVLEVRRPNGTFVCDEFKAEGLNPMLYGLILQKDNSYEELINLRKVFENGVLLLLMEKKITVEQKQQLSKIHKQFAQAVKNGKPEEIIVADIEFHMTITQFTGNKLLCQIDDMIAKLTYASRLKTIEQVLEAGDGQYLIDTHYNLMEKLGSSNIVELYTAIQDSYFYWKDVYK